MLFALDKQGNKIRPELSGQRATCPMCKGELIAKCGDIYVWHWQHYQSIECDSWSEHETHWHKEWKSQFPLEHQEVVISKSGKKHIADVLTKHNVVIEFQNSSISSSTIRTRELFYENMVWVVNAQEFTDNLDIKSEVNSELRKIDRRYSFNYDLSNSSENEYLENVRTELEDSKKKSTETFKCIKQKEEQIVRINEILNAFDQFADKMLQDWEKGSIFWSYSISNIISELSDLKSELRQVIKYIEETQTQIEHTANQIKNIEELENILIEGNEYKIVKYNQIGKNFMHKTKAILKESRATFFPKIISINSDLEFKSYQFKIDKYDFALDLLEKLNSLKFEIHSKEESVTILKNNVEDLKLKIKVAFKEKLLREVEVYSKDVEKLNLDLDNLFREQEVLLEREERQVELVIREKEELESEIERQRNIEKSQAMRKFKGLYTFNWKHERQSWRAAYATVYFDTGADFLLERLSDNSLRKVSKQEFIKLHKSEK